MKGIFEEVLVHRLQTIGSTAVIVLIYAVIWVCAGQSPPVQSPARIQVQSTSVVVDVVVTGKKGEPVTNLEANDFKIFEDNLAQTVLSFEPPSPAPAAPGQSAAPPLTAGPATRRDTARVGNTHFVALAIDMGGLQQQSLQATVKAATEYLEKSLAPDDYIAIYWIGSSLHSALPFTRDKSKAVEAIQGLKGNTSDAVFSTRDRVRTQQEINELQQRETEMANQGDMASLALADMFRSQRMAVQGNMWMQSSFQARAVFRALRAIAQASAALPGRKNVVLFSEGFIHSPEAASQANAVIDAANRANVAIYIVDPLGLTGGRQEGILRAEEQSGLAAPERGSRGRQMISDSRNAQSENLARQGLEISGGYNKFDAIRRLDDDGVTDDLSSIAAATGGILFKNSNDVGHSLNMIDRDLREYYTLVYQPTNQNFNGAFRRIRVEVTGSGNKLRARKGYWALPPGEEAMMTPGAAQMLASVAGGTLKSTVQSKLNAAILPVTSGNAAIPVTMWVQGDSSWVTKATNDRYSAGGTLLVTARDAEGHVVAVQQRFLDLKMTKTQWQTLESEGLVLTSLLNVSSLASYHVQAVLQFSNGEASVAEIKLGIPKADKSPLALSSLVVTPRVDAAQDVDETNPLQVENYQLVLPAQPVFSPSSKMTVYLVMLNYPHSDSGGLQLDLAFAIKSSGKTVRDLPPAELRPFGKLANGAFLLTQFDMGGLTPGSYMLELKVHDQVHGADTIQSAAFSIQ